MICKVVFVVVTCWTVTGITGLPWPAKGADVRQVNDGRYGAYTLTVTDVVLPAHHTRHSLNAEDPATLDTADEDFSNENAGSRRVKRSPSEPSPVFEVQEKDNEGAADDSDMYLNDGDAIAESQHFFPSFYPSYGSPRQHTSYSSSSQRPILQRSNNFQPIGFLHQAQADSSGQDNLLGSGNFGVIRGGTYYNDADSDQGQSSDYDSQQAYTPYYHNNGHGRPSFYKGRGTNPRPQQQDFFANFRDFADINTPTKASYSELYVVYVNKNASRHEQEPASLVHGEKPRNIIEQLALIDLHEKKEPKVPEKKSKLSAGKLKLARTFKPKDKVKKTTSPKELYEPLLALS